MVQEVYPGADMAGGKAIQEYLYGKKAKTEILDEDPLTKAFELICKQAEELVKLRIKVEDLNKLKNTLRISDEDKEAIHADYISWANQLFDDLEDKSVITAEELVGKVLELVENVLEEKK